MIFKFKYSFHNVPKRINKTKKQIQKQCKYEKLENKYECALTNVRYVH